MTDQEMMLAKLDEFSKLNSAGAAKELQGKYAPAPEAPMPMDEPEAMPEEGLEELAGMTEEMPPEAMDVMPQDGMNPDMSMGMETMDAGMGDRPIDVAVMDQDGNPTMKSGVSSENGTDGLGDPMQLLAALDSDAVRQLLGEAMVGAGLEGMLDGQ